jgi:hypothetical protein
MQLVATVTGFGDLGLLPPPTTYADSTAPAGTEVAYFVIANFAGNLSSGISNFARITTPILSVNITGINPTIAAAGYGQMITVFTENAPTGIPTAVFAQPQTQTVLTGFVIPVPSHQNEYWVRLPLPVPPDGPPYTPTLPAGPASVRLDFAQNMSTQEYPLIVSATPTAPQARFVMAMPDPIGSGPCTAAIVSTAQITQITPGQCIAISAYGIDTTGARAVFTQAGSAPISVGATLSTSAGAFGMASVFRVPNTLTAGSVAVQVGTTVNGIASALGNSLGLTVATPPAALPDLRVTLTHYPPNPTDLDIVTATATVTNPGTGAAGPFTLEFCVGAETPGPNGNCRHTQVPGLAPGASYTDTRENTLPAQAHLNAAVADSLSELAESNEGNNTAFDSYSVVAAQGVPVSGTVYYSTAGLAGVTVELGQAPPPVGWNTPPLRRTTSDASGVYTFGSVPAGTGYWVKAYGPTPEYLGWLAPTNLTVAPPGLVRNVDVPKLIGLQTPANYAAGVSLTPTLTWTVNPQAARYVLQINVTAGWVLVMNGDVGNAASYTVPAGLLAANRNYTWQASAYDVAGHYVGATQTSFSFTTAAATTAIVHGTILNQSGGPFPNYDVTVENVSTGASTTVLTNASGDFVFQGLAPGTYRLVTSGVTVGLPAQLTVVAGDVIDLGDLEGNWFAV